MPHQVIAKPFGKTRVRFTDLPGIRITDKNSLRRLFQHGPVTCLAVDQDAFDPLAFRNILNNAQHLLRLPLQIDDDLGPGMYSGLLPVVSTMKRELQIVFCSAGQKLLHHPVQPQTFIRADDRADISQRQIFGLFGQSINPVGLIRSPHPAPGEIYFPIPHPRQRLRPLQPVFIDFQ